MNRAMISATMYSTAAHRNAKQTLSPKMLTMVSANPGIGGKYFSAIRPVPLSPYSSARYANGVSANLSFIIPDMINANDAVPTVEPMLRMTLTVEVVIPISSDGVTFCTAIITVELVQPRPIPKMNMYTYSNTISPVDPIVLIRNNDMIIMIEPTTTHILYPVLLTSIPLPMEVNIIPKTIGNNEHPHCSVS